MNASKFTFTPVSIADGESETFGFQVEHHFLDTTLIVAYTHGLYTILRVYSKGTLDILYNYDSRILHIEPVNWNIETSDEEKIVVGVLINDFYKSVYKSSRLALKLLDVQIVRNLSKLFA